MFQEMFPGQISNDFTMSRTKVSYMLSDGLGPYFRGEQAKQISENKVYYTLQFDETGDAQGNKQCDVLVRFWNSDTGQVISVSEIFDVWACKGQRSSSSLT